MLLAGAAAAGPECGCCCYRRKYAAGTSICSTDNDPHYCS